MIPRDFVDTVLDRVDIVDIIEQYVPLKRAGSNFVARCPFHSEKTPSFTVSQDKQFYHCLGCGANGNAVGFLIQFSGLSFPDAVEELAGRVGMKLPENDARPSAPRVPLEARQALERAVRFYREQLKGSQKAIAYLKGRGVSGPIAARFGLGYAPDGWQGLASVFPEYSGSALAEAGLVIDSDGGRRYDRFRDRVMFPVLDARGEIIGFGGRVLGSGEPKYLNSPETALFQKGSELYGLPQARRAIRERGRVLVVEGYMDVIALAQNGVEYAVATLGTATTPVHAQKLLRLADLVVFCFDGDAAGRRAAWKALEHVLPLTDDGKSIRFLFLPAGEDPDSYVRSAGQEAFEREVEQALPLSTYLRRELAQGVDLSTAEGRAQLVHRARPLLERIAAPMLKLLIRNELSETVGIAPEELSAAAGIKMPSPSRRTVAAPPRRPAGNIETALLICLLHRPELAQSAQAQDLHALGDESALGNLCGFLCANPQLGHAGAIMEHYRGSPFEGVLRQAAVDGMERYAGFSPAEIEQEFDDGVGRLMGEVRDRASQRIIDEARNEGQKLTPDQERLYREWLELRR